MNITRLCIWKHIRKCCIWVFNSSDIVKRENVNIIAFILFKIFLLVFWGGKIVFEMSILRHGLLKHGPFSSCLDLFILGTQNWLHCQESNKSLHRHSIFTELTVRKVKIGSYQHATFKGLMENSAIQNLRCWKHVYWLK